MVLIFGPCPLEKTFFFPVLGPSFLILRVLPARWPGAAGGPSGRCVLFASQVCIWPSGSMSFDSGAYFFELVPFIWLFSPLLDAVVPSPCRHFLCMVVCRWVLFVSTRETGILSPSNPSPFVLAFVLVFPLLICLQSFGL